MDNKSAINSNIENPITSCANNEASFGNASFKVATATSLPVLTDEELFPRESLGILPNCVLFRDSLTSDFLSNNPTLPMESGRESIGIFNINNPVFKVEFTDFQNALSPQLAGSKMSSSTLSDLNKGFLLPHSRKISGLSSGSSGISFNVRSFEEISKISTGNSTPKELMAVTDPLNTAFRLVDGVQRQSESCNFASTRYSFADNLLNNKRRILSMPLTFKEGNILGDVPIGNIIDNISFDGGLICRGIEGERYLDDSVFFNRELVNEDTPFIWKDKSFDEERYLLDSTPQPDWDQWDSPKGKDDGKIKSPILNKDNVFKKVDEMLGMQPANLKEKIKVNTNTFTMAHSPSSVNMSHNISKISKASQCSLTEHPSYPDNNYTQDLNKSPPISEGNVSWVMKNLSQIINEKEDLSKSQKNEGRDLLHRLASLLTHTGNKSANSEDSGHSSIVKAEKANNSGKVLEALDLSCKNKSNDILSRSKSPSIRNPPPYVVYNPNHTGLGNKSLNEGHTSASTNEGNKDSAKYHRTSSLVSLRRHTSITHTKANSGLAPLKKSKSGNLGSSKMEPLRAVLPVENMAKAARNVAKTERKYGTPEKNKAIKFGIKSSKTSTPLQEPQLKPMAASTPAVRQSLGFKEKPKFTRSFTLNQPVTNNKSAENSLSKDTANKNAPKHVRRNSVSGINMYSREMAFGGSPRAKRSFSTGKEPNILSALNKVKQNILSSPYYNPPKSTAGVQDGAAIGEKAGNKVSVKKPDKENLKP